MFVFMDCLQVWQGSLQTGLKSNGLHQEWDRDSSPDWSSLPARPDLQIAGQKIRAQLSLQNEGCYNIQFLKWFSVCTAGSDFFVFRTLQSYIYDHFGTLMENQLWQQESSVSKMTLRSALLEIACSLDIANCTQQAKHLYDLWVAPNTTYQ